MDPRHNPHLNYFNTSPIRGQLEPADASNARTGWRYIQCTDTPNQLKVLLPPKTAALYAHLLKMEAYELSQGERTQWQKVMEIRHLKDRMIRKCMRLATPPGAQTHAQALDVAFRTVYAPPDFRLKEMEKYLKTHETKPASSSKKSRNHANNGNVASPNPAGHHDPLSPQAADAFSHLRSPASISPRSPDALARSPLRSPLESGHRPISPVTYTESIFNGGGGASGGPSIGTPDVVGPTPTFPEPQLDLLDDPSPPIPPGPGASLFSPPGGEEPHLPNAYGDGHPHTLSPEPLPHPYRGDRTLSPLPEQQQGGFASFADLGLPPTAEPMPSPLPGAQPVPSAVDETDRDEVGPLPEGRPLVRRRSSLKRGDSSSRLSLNGSARGVSFAMDLSRTEMVARDVEVAANELNDLRESYRSQLARIRDERQSIADNLRKLHLQEDSLRQQEDKLHDTYRALDEKELHYRNKVLAALEESKRGLQATKAQQIQAQPTLPMPQPTFMPGLP